MSCIVTYPSGLNPYRLNLRDLEKAEIGVKEPKSISK